MVFQHGVIARYRDTVTRPVTEVPSNVIALVGTFPTYALAAGNRHIDVPIRVIGDVDDALFSGPKTVGFTGPYALDAIRDNGGGTVDIINVFNPETHKTTATEDFTLVNGQVQLKRVEGSLVSTTDATGLTGALTVAGFIEDIDYTINRTTGLLKRTLTGAIAVDDTVTVEFTYADPSKVTPAEIIGTTVDGVRSGMQALKNLFNLRGYTPKMLIVPVFNEDGGVASEMEVLSEKLSCYFFLDAPAGSSRDEVVAGRSGAAPVGTFQTSNKRAVLCYPRVLASDNTVQPLSQYAAAVTAGTDLESGYWFSPSNHVIQGIQGIEPGVNLSGDYTATSTDINALNAAGIVTVMANAFGVGLRLWGNRAASYPTDTSPLNFIAVGRTVDIVTESIQRASLPFVDKPISTALIDTILATAQAFLYEQIQLGALVSGSEVTWNKQLNANTQLAAGRVLFSIRLMVPTPLELLIYESTLDINLLSNILPTSEVAA